MTGPRLAVVGAGVMGTGIAALAVGHGLPVLLSDVDGDALERARTEVPRALRLAAMMNALPPGVPRGELSTTTGLDAVATATTVVESVTERPELKAEVLAEVSGLVATGTPLLSNTSAIPVDELAAAVARPGELLGVHFMNPPYLIPAVEVIRGPRTEEATMTAALDLLTALGRRPIVVGDGPGFVINRVLQRMINEAARIVQDGVATPEAVDALFTGCLGHRTGPLTTADLIGLDNVVDSLRVLHDRTGDDGYRPCDLLLSKLAAGHLGRKSGQGFFPHT